MHHSRIILEKVENVYIQQNLRMYGHRKYGPYKLIVEKVQNAPGFVVRVECQGHRLGKVPDKFGVKLARAIKAGMRHEARPRKLIQRPDSNRYDLMIKIYPVPKRKKLSKREYEERKKWGKALRERYGRKWYS